MTQLYDHHHHSRYLAEDRVLCFELLAKKNTSWTLEYVKAAKAHTDVPEGVPELILQRRRWLNGSFFAAVYAITNWWRLWGTGHSAGRKFWFQVQLVYNLISMFFTWFSLVGCCVCYCNYLRSFVHT